MVQNLKTRLLALRLLETVLPAVDSAKHPELAMNTVSKLFSALSDSMWTLPTAVAKQQVASQQAEVCKKVVLIVEIVLCRCIITLLEFCVVSNVYS